MVSWDTDTTFERLKKEFDIREIGNHWCYIHPRREGGEVGRGS
jgi:hypothetical protein